MSALDDFRKEMEFNIGDAELSEGFTLVRGSQSVSIVSVVGYSNTVTESKPATGMFSDAWKREEKDGKLSPERPSWMPSVVIPLYKLLEAGISPAEYEMLKVVRGDITYSVVSHAGSDPVRLFLKVGTEEHVLSPIIEPPVEPSDYDGPVIEE